MTNNEIANIVSESLRDWFKKEKWVRISTSGNIAGPCGTSKNKKNPDRCLPKAKAQSLSKAERAATARKKKKAGKKGKTVVKNTKKATVTREDIRNLVIGTIHEMENENTIMEKDDRCTRLAKQKYDTWPSAYASGAVVRCRRGEIWKKNESVSEEQTGKKLQDLQMGEKFTFNGNEYTFIELYKYPEFPNAARVIKPDGKKAVVSFGGGKVNTGKKAGIGPDAFGQGKGHHID
jgi:hypothetical protein